jgi:hypothetical protein
MAKQRSNALSLLAWITGVVVSLVVGNGMIQGILVLPNWLGGSTIAGMWIAQAIGWIVLVITIISAIMAIIRR